MDTEQARIILSAHRPESDDAEEIALFEEALAVMERDPGLAEWFAGQSRLDTAMRDALRSIQPPADLKAAILAGAKTVELPATTRPNSWITPTWLALAAAVAVAAGILFLVPHGPDRRVPLAAIDAAIPQMTRAHEHLFATEDNDIGKIRAWLASHGGAKGFDLPAGLRGISGMGCEIASVQGAKVSVVCFEMPGGGAAHLYVMDRSELRDAPPEGRANIQQHDGIAMASWSDARHSYILAMAGSDNAVRALL
jgi:hypothetical protein